MKKVLLSIFIILALLVVLVITTKPLVVSFVKKKIEEAGGNQVSGVDVRLEYSPWSLVWRKVAGDISIGLFKHDKLKIRNVKINARWHGGYIYLESFTGDILNGTVIGSGDIQLSNPINYVIKLQFNNLDLKRFVHDFELHDKFVLTGFLNGKVTLSGVGQKIHILDGDLTSSIGGGDLTISDTKFLENMAASAKLPSNLVVDSFKNYHYNEGLVRMFMDQGNLHLDVGMEGKGGKRNLNVVLHDFNLN